MVIKEKESDIPRGEGKKEPSPEDVSSVGGMWEGGLPLILIYFSIAGAS